MIDCVIQRIAEAGWCVQPGFLHPQLVRELAAEADTLHQTQVLQPASIGQGKQKQLLTQLRGDSIHWLDDHSASSAQQDFFQRMEALRQAANRELQLGLFELECHYARYPVGGGYKKHLDVFQQDSRRALSVICYLNQDWQPQYGGQLRMDLEDSRQLDVLPEGGTLVCFLSHRFPHEVLPATHPRLSLTGWFRRR